MNHLIERLPHKERVHLLALCRPVVLHTGDLLCEAADPTRHVWFPDDGFVSLLTLTAGSPPLEVGMTGADGMLGGQLLLGLGKVPLRAVAQGAGTAQRLPAGAFRRELADSPALRRVVGVYLGDLMGQLAAAAACQHFHSIRQRLASWLLNAQDRAQTDRLQATHESLAGLLGVRRVGITNAAGDLQRRGLIAYRRGDLKIVDRSGLEAAACVCYAAAHQAGGGKAARKVAAPQSER